MTRKNCELSVIIPAYNEEANIRNTVHATYAALSDKVKSFEIIIVNDGSKDRTAAVVENLIKEKKLKDCLKLVTYSPNMGKGWALKNGFEASVGQYIAFFDADLDISPDHITQYLDVLKNKNVDTVVASKRHKDSILEYSRIRILISTIYYLFNRIFFRLKVRDTQSGVKVFRRKILEITMPGLLVKRFAFDLELLVNIRRQGGLIHEEAVHIQDHNEYGRIGVLSLWHAFMDTVAVFYRLAILKYYEWDFLPLKTKKLKFSILINTVGYSGELQRMVESCREQFHEQFEIILLSDNGSFELPGARVVETGKISQFEKWQLGAKNARGGVLVFLNEGMYPQQDWLKRAAAYFSYPEIYAVTGPVMEQNGNGFWESIGAFVRKNIFVGGRLSYRHNQRRQRMIQSSNYPNLFIKKDLFKKTVNELKALYEENDPELYFASLAETEFGILYSPDLKVKSSMPHIFRKLFPEFAEKSLKKGCFCHKSSHGECSLMAYVPAFFLIALVTGVIFSFFSEVFRNVFLIAMGIYFGFVYLSIGQVYKVYRNIPIVFGVISATCIKGFNFLRGIFSNTFDKKLKKNN